MHWIHFTPKSDQVTNSRGQTIMRVVEGQCKHCKAKPINVRNGSSGLGKHVLICSGLKNRTTRPFNDLHRESGFHVKARRFLVEMIIVDELPFLFPEHEGFLRFLKYVCPDYEAFLIKKDTVRKDAFRIRDELKEIIQTDLDNALSRISFTSDIWTANTTQIGFMVVTAHYISCEWKYVDVILSFKAMQPSHSGVNINSVFFEVIREWKLEKKIMCCTLDNSSSNGTFVEAFLKTNEAKNCIMEGNLPIFHVRCFAHILTLVAQDGLKVMEGSIEGLRNAVKKSHSSHQQIEKFEYHCNVANVPAGKAKPILDVATRWNSTYDMIQAELPYLPAFRSWAEEAASTVQP
jgi:hypothetical protein